MRPTQTQWPTFQAIGIQLIVAGAQGVLYGSAARTRSVCLCVYEAGLDGLSVEGEPVRIITVPPPPAGCAPDRSDRPPAIRRTQPKGGRMA
jgi:hypothetical protein